MALPGPGPVGVFADLILLAVVAILIGEPIRSLIARRSEWFRSLDPVERLLVDLYLGGALVYLVAEIPGGVYYPAAIAAAALVPWALRAWWWGSIGPGARRAIADLRRWAGTPWAWAVPAAFLGLLVVEVSAAAPISTGNTYDSSLYSTYVALLLLHHAAPTSFAPLAGMGLTFPQGATVWFSLGQGLLGFPAVRTSLLETPLFLALGSPGAYVLVRRWWGTVRAGAAAAILFALMAPFPRELVAGSNDLVLALPLVLVLAGLARGWTERPIPRWPDALAFGALLGTAAALNPVGPQWLALVIVALAGLAVPRWGGSLREWLPRYVGAVGLALVVVAPTLGVLVAGRSSPGLVPGGATLPPGTPFGTSTAEFLGGIDPFLFRPDDTWLSPFPLLRLELALLIVVGIGILLLAGDRRLPAARPIARFCLVGGVVAAALMGVFVLAGAGVPGTAAYVYLTSVTQLSVYLFVVYSILAAVPLVVLLERGGAPVEARGELHPPGTPSSDPRTAGWAVTLLVAVAVVLPGVAVSAVSMPGQLDTVYGRYSSVTSDDLALLTYIAGHAPSGARVLVAPGSAAEFLPVYDPNVVLLYPMVPNFADVNGSYSLVVRELTNSTLDAAGQAALSVLGVTDVAVTGASTTLFPPFDPAPLSNDTALTVTFHQGDAWLFEATG